MKCARSQRVIGGGIACGVALFHLTEAHAQVPVAAPVESILFWTPQQQLERYPAIEHVYETRTVRRGARVAPLPRADQELKVTIDWKGKPASIEEFMRTYRVTGLLVLKDGRIALERYALGRKPEERWTSFSVAKSITSTLIGAAIKDGYIKSLDAPVTAYLRELTGSGYDGVTLRQLLTMTSGVKWNEDYRDPNSDVAQASRTPIQPGQFPLVEYMRKLPSEATPGTKFNYKTGETDLAGLVVMRATGKTLADYLSEKIWQPYGMEQDAVWLLDRARTERGGCCISMTLRDYARFGQFILDGGRANGREVLPDDWIRTATTTQVPPSVMDATLRETTGDYGYFWWTHPDGSFEANGLFGQKILVFPRDRVVIALNSAQLEPNSPDTLAAVGALMATIHAAAK